MPKEKEPKKAKRIELDETSDAFGEEEQKRIVKLVIDDADADKEVMKEWLKQRKLDLQHYEGEKPSILENLKKRGWMSDRNMGLCAAICDTFQSVLLSTCHNVDTLNYKATEANDVDNKDNLERFSKWGLGSDEANFFPEADDYIHNKVTGGFSAFEIYWKVWYEWVDRRIPKKDPDNAKNMKGYNIKTEKMRFEKGVIENIDNLEDLLMPKYGGDIQELKHIIRVIHLHADDFLQAKKRKIFININKNWVKKVKDLALAKKSERTEGLSEEKGEQLGLDDVFDEELKALPIDCYRWYGWYDKNGKWEKYRFIIEPLTETFLSGKPLRKIARTGEYPIVGGAFIRRPGYVRGKSMPRLIMHPVNAFNNTWNQKSDFQYMVNCPFGFFKPSEEYKNQKYDIEPGVMFPSDDPSSFNFPNLSRSMAWAETDMRIIFEIVERLTGAATYFLTHQTKTGTLGRDEIIERKGETRFGLWVSRIQAEFDQAITMWMNLYQDWAPPTLGERVLGKDGKQLFPNLSVASLRGNYRAFMEPDITAGSKAFERQVMMMAVDRLSQSPWVHPQINPRGNYNMWADFLRVIGKYQAERYLGPEPKAEMGQSQEVKDEWSRFMRGEAFDPPEGATPQAIEHYTGHTKQKEEQYNELDEEYRSNFDAHLFKTFVNAMQFTQQKQNEQVADQMAYGMIQNRNRGIADEVEAPERGRRRPEPTP